MTHTQGRRRANFALRGFYEVGRRFGPPGDLAPGGGYLRPRKQQARGSGIRGVLILFVEHHAAFRQSASYLMDREPDMEVVSQAGSVAEARQRMAEGGVDAAIVDIPLPDDGAPEMVRDLCGANPSIPVLVMTHIEDTEVHGK